MSNELEDIILAMLYLITGVWFTAEGFARNPKSLSLIIIGTLELILFVLVLKEGWLV